MTKENKSKILDCKPEGEHICPIKDIMARFGDKWSIYVIIYLGKNDKLRFNELKGMVTGISQRMLTVTLRSLEEDGLVNRTVYPEIPPRVEYELTLMGKSLLEQLIKLSDWASTNIEQVLEARKQYALKSKKLQPVT